MKKYVVFYKASKEALEKTKDTPPEEREAGMKKWKEWSEKCGDSLVEMGNPLAPPITVTGPDNSNEILNIGYSIVQAEDLEKAKELFKDHPHYGWDDSCAITLQEIMPLPGSE
jgi:hypothetical protein